MQSLRWYVSRLRVMPPREVARRARRSLRGVTDRILRFRRRRLRRLSALFVAGGDDGTPGCRVSDVRVGEWSRRPACALERGWLEALTAKADQVASHRLSFFDLEDCYLGDPVDWNREHKVGKCCPMKFAPSIDYRDFRVTGDCKFVWEPSRHHQLVVLARAYRAGGDVRYAEAVVEQLDSWLDQCPFGMGMQWRSPLELGIRLINWVWAVDLIRESGLVAGDFRRRLLNSVYRHLWQITREYSYGSSANNHLIGEAAGVFVATSYFRSLRKAQRWREQSRNRLCREMMSQTFEDGGSREQAIGYHLFVLQLFLIAGLVGRRTREDFGPEYWNRLEKMFEFVGVLSEGGQHLPAFGDADDGYVLDLDGNPRDCRPWLATAAVLFDRPDFKTWAGSCGESTRWLMGEDGRERFEVLGASQAARPVASRAFPATGYYLLQSGRRSERISVVCDCGELGMGSLCAHGHADALSFTLRAFGVDVLVDPGTYDYFTYPQWREYFRSTRAHNTIVIDGGNQSVMQGAFIWRTRAHAQCLAWEPTASGGAVIGEQDGYRGLSDPVVHRRKLSLDGQQRRLTICDEIIAMGEHQVQLYFHFAEQCRLAQMQRGRYCVDVGPGVVTITLDERLAVEVLHGSADPIAGWVSRGYHRKTASTTLVGCCSSRGSLVLTCQVDIGEVKMRHRQQPIETVVSASRPSEPGVLRARS